MLPTEVTTAELARLLGVSRRNFPGLAERKSIVPGSRKGTYALEPSISGYAKHPRRLAQGRHGTGETLSTAESRRYGVASSALFHNRILTQELRDCLTELADNEKGVAS
jgi:hypothetical protein